MKKRIAFALAAIMAVSMFSGCGSDAASDEPETEEARPRKTKKSTTAEENTPEEATADSAITVTAESDPAEPDNNAPAETTTAETTTAAPEEPAAPVELPTITKVKNVYGNNKLVKDNTIAFVADGKTYAYNTLNNEIYEVGCDLKEISSFCGRILLGKDFLVNLKTGERIECGRDEYYYNNTNGSDFICVRKTEQAFSGNTTYFGILNADGEWAMPMSSEYAICEDNGAFFKGMEERGHYEIGVGGYAEGVLQNDKVLCPAGGNYLGFYDKAKDDYTFWDENGNYTVYYITEDNIIILEDPDGYAYSSSETVYSLYRYDINTGEKTFLVEIPDGSELPYRYDGKSRFYYAIKDKAVKLFDHNYEFIAEYDLSEFDFFGGGIYNADENTIVFKANGADGGKYAVVMNKDGSFVCEPFLDDSPSSGSVDGGYFTENKVIFYYEETGEVFSIDRKTGERTDFSDKFDFVGYDDTNDRMVVQKDNAYYMVDPENPDKLINPFEIAKLMN